MNLMRKLLFVLIFMNIFFSAVAQGELCSGQSMEKRNSAGDYALWQWINKPRVFSNSEGFNYYVLPDSLKSNNFYGTAALSAKVDKQGKMISLKLISMQLYYKQNYNIAEWVIYANNAQDSSYKYGLDVSRIDCMPKRVGAIFSWLNIVERTTRQFKTTVPIEDMKENEYEYFYSVSLNFTLSPHYKERWALKEENKKYIETNTYYPTN